MGYKANEILREGLKILDPLMKANGFCWQAGPAGKGSGGHFDSGRYVKDDRQLELHFRHSLGLVTYHVGELALSHTDFMQMAAPTGHARYPGFSSDPLDAFRGLAFDLEQFGTDFLSGPATVFQAAVDRSKETENLSGFKRFAKDSVKSLSKDG